MTQNKLSVSRDTQPAATLGQWLSRRRRHLGLTQKALAARARCSEAWVKKIEQDRHPPGEELATALAEALEIPKHYRTAFVRAVRTGNFADQPAPDTLESLPEPPTQPPLPSQPTRFFGRARELQEIARALTDPGCRLLTLLGPGGIGKTRLSLQAAELQQSAFDAVYFVSLREVDSREGIAQAIADALQLPRLAQSDPTLQIAAFLREVQPKTLLVLDNFEHLIEGAEVVDTLLEHAREAKILVTSRERLRSVWEQILLVDGLEYPSEGDADNLEAFTSVQLFVERARRAFPRFPYKAEARDVARLCRLVEGHPLAIELAAAWVASFACDEIVAQIENNIEVLKKQREDISDAHRSVTATFDYSYTLLAPPEQQVFRTLGLFESSFELDAAARVAGAERRTLAELVDKSLIQRAGRRFNLHELLRLYAAEKLAANTAEAQTAGAQMFRYYLDYARTHQQDYAILEFEWSNLNTGLRLAHEQQAWQAVSDYVTALKQPWEMRGRYSDARQAYRLACEAAQARGDEKAYADALREWGRACVEQGDYAEAEKYLEQSLELCERLEYQAGIANAQFDLARIAMEGGDYDKAERRLEQSRFIYEQLGGGSDIAATFRMQAYIAYYKGEFERAENSDKQALAIWENANDKRGSLQALRHLAFVALEGKGSLDSAEVYCVRALNLAEEIEDRGELASVLRTASEIFRRQKNYNMARSYAEKSLELFKLIGDRKSQAQALYRLSVISNDQHELDLALQLGNQSLELCKEMQDNWGMVFVLEHLGSLYMLLGIDRRARESWFEGENIAAGFQNMHPRLKSIQERLRAL